MSISIQGPASQCRTCQGLLDTLEGAFDTTYSQISVSALNGCFQCRCVADLMFKQAYCEFVVLDVTVRVERTTDGSVQVWEKDDNKPKDERIGLEMVLNRLSLIADEPGSEDALEKIHHWSRSCLDTHTGCEREELAALPTRVLDLERPEPCVWETHGTKAKYIALSHCWGLEKGLTATERGMPMLMSRINVDALLPTFRDAITITRAMNIRYLWIDSLCIIQDSLEDWTRESSKMWDVYRHSHLTIVAAGSDSDAKGFLGPREHPQGVYTTHDSGKDVSLTSRRHAHSGPREPLYSRAWTFQERFLSPRMIKFKRRELEWHCRAAKICECGRYTDTHGTPYDGLAPPAMAPNYESVYQSLLSVPLEKVLSVWRNDIVQPYSRLELTRWSDRLPALSGIATMISSRFPQEPYLAGIWQSDIVRGLQWYLEDVPGPLDHAERALQAPSWSWASVRGAISYPRSSGSMLSGSNKTLMHLLSAHCDFKGSDKHGVCTRGVLRIEAPLLKISAKITTSPDNQEPRYAFTRLWTYSSISVRGDSSTPKECLFYPDDSYLSEETLSRGPSRIWSQGTWASDDTTVSVWLLFLESERYVTAKRMRYRCLVLGVRKSLPQLFRRLGYWAFDTDDLGWYDDAEMTTVRIV